MPEGICCVSEMWVALAGENVLPIYDFGGIISKMYSTVRRISVETKNKLTIGHKSILSRDLCSKLAQSASVVIEHDVLITDDEGYVLACSDEKRVGTLHEASLEVIRSGQKAHHNVNAVRYLAGTKPGMTIPILMDGNVIGTVGVTGAPEEISKFALLMQQMAQVFLGFQTQQQDTIQEDYWRQRIFREIITYDKRTRDPVAVYNSAYEMGIDLNILRIAVLLELRGKHAGGSRTQINSFARGKLYKHFGGKQDFVCMQNEMEYVVFAAYPDGDEHAALDDLREKCAEIVAEITGEGYDVRIAIGIPSFCLEEIWPSYENACFVMQVMQSGIRTEKCLAGADVTLERMATSLPENICSKITEDFFRVLAGSGEWDEVMELIGHWCRSKFHFTQTAQAMHIHKSTLVYRFNRVKTLYGLDLYDFHQVMTLYLIHIRQTLG